MRFDISDLGELSWLLGLKVEHDRQNRSIALSQQAYVQTVVERFWLQDARSAHTPMHSGSVLSVDQSPSSAEQAGNMQDVPYQRAIGSLMYVTTSTNLT